MPSARNLFVRFTSRVSRWPDLPLDDHVADATHTEPPGEGDRTTPPAPKPPEPSPAPAPPRRPVGQTWPSPRTWVDAELTETEAAREDLQLTRLAAETARTDPWTAALTVFGGNDR